MTKCRICEEETAEKEICPSCQSDQETMKQAFEEEEKHNRELMNKDSAILKSIEEEFGEEIIKTIHEELQESCSCLGLAIVDKQKGEKSEETRDGINIYYDQTVNGGYEGDNFEGWIWIELPNKKYLQSYYSM